MLRTMAILVAKTKGQSYKVHNCVSSTKFVSVTARNVALRITDVVDRTRMNQSPNRGLNRRITFEKGDLAVVATIPQLRIISQIR